MGAIIDGFKESTPEVEAAYTAKEKKALKEQRKKDSKARFLLYQGLDESTFERVAEATTSKKAWEILATICKGVELVKRIRLQILRGDIEAAQIKDEENISDYYSRLLLIVNKMRRNGEKMEDIQVMEKLLRSLTQSSSTWWRQLRSPRIWRRSQ